MEFRKKNDFFFQKVIRFSPYKKGQKRFRSCPRIIIMFIMM